MERWKRGRRATCSGGVISLLDQGQAAPDRHEKKGYAFSPSQALCMHRGSSHSQSVPSRRGGLRDSQMVSQGQQLVFFKY